MQMYAIWAVQCPHDISEINAELPRGTELNVLLNQFGWCDSLLEDKGGAHQYLHVVFECFWEHNLKLKPTKCEFFWNEINYLAHHVSKKGVTPSKENVKAVAEFTPPWTYMEIQAFLH